MYLQLFIRVFYQVITLLNNYTPFDDSEARIPAKFIREVQEKLQARQAGNESQVFLIDTDFSFAVSLPFNPSPLDLESITFPADWGLGFFKHL